MLSEAKGNAEHQARERAERRDKPPFEQEDAANSRFVRAEMREDADVFTLVDDEHGERTDDIEAGDEQDEN